MVRKRCLKPLLILPDHRSTKPLIPCKTLATPLDMVNSINIMEREGQIKTEIKKEEDKVIA